MERVNFALAARSSRFWPHLLAVSDPRRRRTAVWATCGLLLGIGAADFVLGFEISLLVFYILPVCLAVASLGGRFGTATAVASVATWLIGDIAAGAHYADPRVPCWNALFALATYLVVVWLLSSLLALAREMEERVRQRTAALVQEITERERLEKIVLEIGERERRSIGHDLHDGLGQHLTGTALTGQLLAEKLEERAAPETADAKKMVSLVKIAIGQTRKMAKGLLLADIDADGLAGALQEFCASATEQFRVKCLFEGESRMPLRESGVASHLYRIAQESVRNSVRHGHASEVKVYLGGTKEKLELSIHDDGVGMPPPEKRGEGLGLRIMAHRAQIIGATFAIETKPGKGTVVLCSLPLLPHESR